MKKLNLLALAFVLFLSAPLFAQTYAVDGAKSTLEWTGSKITGVHTGNVQISKGKLVNDEGKFSGNFTIDMTSINCTDLEGEMKGKLEGHLASEDFFNVANHNTAELNITKIRPARPIGEDAPNYIVTGELTIKGITDEIQFPALITFNEDGSMTADASFTIDRTKWEIKYGSGSWFDGLGDKMIYDDIEFVLSLVANKAHILNVTPAVKPTTRPSKSPFGSKR